METPKLHVDAFFSPKSPAKTSALIAMVWPATSITSLFAKVCPFLLCCLPCFIFVLIINLLTGSSNAKAKATGLGPGIPAQLQAIVESPKRADIPEGDEEGTSSRESTDHEDGDEYKANEDEDEDSDSGVVSLVDEDEDVVDIVEKHNSERHHEQVRESSCAQA